MVLGNGRHRNEKRAGKLVPIAGTLTLFLLSLALNAQKPASEPGAAKDALAVLERCSQCHGAALQMSGLNLSTREGMLKGGEKGPAIVPGNAEASLLYKRVAGLQAPLMPMPPVPPLKPEEIALLKGWIDQGVKWPGEAAATPAVTAAKTPSSPQSAYPGGYTPREITAEDRN
jgi:hypothetical protein